MPADRRLFALATDWLDSSGNDEVMLVQELLERLRLAVSSLSVTGQLTFAVAPNGTIIPNPIVQDLLFTDNLFDIGKSGATRPRDLFLARLLDISAAGAGQVKFPATQNPSADANTLDDYRENTWTPTVGGSGGESGQVYSLQTGLVIKLGQLVFISGAVALSTLGTITGAVQIKGLPFASNAATINQVVPIVWNAFTTAAVLVQGVIGPSSSVISVRLATAATTAFTTGAVQGDLSNTSSFNFAACYRAAA